MGHRFTITHMSTMPQPNAARQSGSQSIAQQHAEINRLLAETLLLEARQTKARVEREVRFSTQYRVFARHDWLLPAVAALSAMAAGAALMTVLTGFVKFTGG
jgi:cytochrome c-type biogenesis protein CcmH/NrfG